MNDLVNLLYRSFLVSSEISSYLNIPARGNERFEIMSTVFPLTYFVLEPYNLGYGFCHDFVLNCLLFVSGSCRSLSRGTIRGHELVRHPR